MNRPSVATLASVALHLAAFAALLGAGALLSDERQRVEALASRSFSAGADQAAELSVAESSPSPPAPAVAPPASAPEAPGRPAPAMPLRNASLGTRSAPNAAEVEDGLEGPAPTTNLGSEDLPGLVFSVLCRLTDTVLDPGWTPFTRGDATVRIELGPAGRIATSRVEASEPVLTRALEQSLSSLRSQRFKPDGTTTLHIQAVSLPPDPPNGSAGRFMRCKSDRAELHRAGDGKVVAFRAVR